MLLDSQRLLTDHGALIGLLDDDHTQYALLDGTRTFTSLITSSTLGLVIPSTATYAFTRNGDSDTGLYFNVSNARYEFHRDGVAIGYACAETSPTYSFGGFYSPVLLVPGSDCYVFTLQGAKTTGLYFNVTSSSVEYHLVGSVKHTFDIINGDYTSGRDITSGRNLIIGSGAAGVDYTLTFDGETNDGVLTWLEDEDIFRFSDDLLIQNGEKIYFRGTGVGIYSQATNYIDIFATNALRIGDSSAGAPTNYAVFKADGELNLVGTARVLRHVHIPIAAIKKGASNPPLETVVGNTPVLQFDASSEEDGFYTIHMPESWDSSSDVVFHFHWAPTSTDTGSVVWAIDYRISKSESGEVISGTDATLTVTDAAQGTTNEHLQSGDVTISHTLLETSDKLALRFYRKAADASDTYADDAALIFPEMIYYANKLGEAT